MAKRKITVEGTEISFYSKKKEDYICITDMAKSSSSRTDIIIQRWLRNGNTIDFLALWESLYNPNFNPTHLDGIRIDNTRNSFVLSVKEWVEKTNAIGIESRAGRYGGTYAHKDIAFEFGSWLSPSFKLRLILEFQRLKEEESTQKGIEWDVNRTLAKVNYVIHTDAVRENMVPLMQHRTKYEGAYFASEADLLNKVVFGMTAKEWKQINPKLKGNMRDYATIEQLLILANMENLNAEYMSLNLPQSDRYIRLCKVADHQFSLIANNPSLKSLEDKYKKE